MKTGFWDAQIKKKKVAGKASNLAEWNSLWFCARDLTEFLYVEAHKRVSLKFCKRV